MQLSESDKQAMWRAVSYLNPVQFLSFLFADLEGHDIMELAERLHCGRREAQIEVQKARQQVRRRLRVQGLR